MKMLTRIFRLRNSCRQIQQSLQSQASRDVATLHDLTEEVMQVFLWNQPEEQNASLNETSQLLKGFT